MLRGDRAPIAPVVDQLLYTISETEQKLRLSHSSVYRLISAGALDLVKIGKSSRITAASIKRVAEGGAP